MVSEATIFLADDGARFNTREEALHYERMRDARALLDQTVMDGRADRYDHDESASGYRWRLLRDMEADPEKYIAALKAIQEAQEKRK